jgi:hypothetical protein
MGGHEQFRGQVVKVGVVHYTEREHLGMLLPRREINEQGAIGTLCLFLIRLVGSGSHA